MRLDYCNYDIRPLLKNICLILNQSKLNLIMIFISIVTEQPMLNVSEPVVAHTLSPVVWTNTILVNAGVALTLIMAVLASACLGLQYVYRYHKYQLAAAHDDQDSFGGDSCKWKIMEGVFNYWILKMGLWLQTIIDLVLLPTFFLYYNFEMARGLTFLLLERHLPPEKLDKNKLSNLTYEDLPHFLA